jgi:hypothetical protein
MVSFCYFFFVNSFARRVDKARCRNPWNRVEKGLAPGYVFPGCNPYYARLRVIPLAQDWMHPGPLFAGSIPDSLMGRRFFNLPYPLSSSQHGTSGGS